MLIPLLVLAGAGLAAYEYFKPKAPTQPSASGQTAPQLLINAKNLAAQAGKVLTTITGATVSGAPTTTSSASVDPVTAAASMAANALLHGQATDPAVQLQVKAFQAAAGGLTVDGKYGPQTQSALQRYIPNAPPAPAVYGGTG